MVRGGGFLPPCVGGGGPTRPPPPSFPTFSRPIHSLPSCFGRVRASFDASFRFYLFRQFSRRVVMQISSTHLLCSLLRLPPETGPVRPDGECPNRS